MHGFLWPRRKAAPNDRPISPRARAAIVTFVIGSAAAPAAHPAAQHAHVHGVAKLGIATQGRVLSLSLEAPLDSLIGFEHLPRTPAERAAVDSLRARMDRADGLFEANAEAGCVRSKVTTTSALFGPNTSATESDPHADLDVDTEYVCAEPARLVALETSLFTAFPRLRRLEVQLATETTQAKQTLTSPARRIALTRNER